jgi:type II secretory pathway pseudopilin PulG
MAKNLTKGFILIEILVSILIFSAGVLFLIQSLSGITRSNQQISDNYYSLLLIDNLFNRLASGEILASTGTQTISNKIFIWQIDYSNSLEGLKEIMVKVNWLSKGKIYSANLKQQIILVEQ